MTFTDFQCATERLLTRTHGLTPLRARELIATYAEHQGRPIYDGTCPRGTAGPPDEWALALTRLHDVTTDGRYDATSPFTPYWQPASP